MDLSTSLLLGVLFGSFGMGYIVYGKKQRKGVALIPGNALCTFPYFVQNIYLFIFVGILFYSSSILMQIITGSSQKCVPHKLGRRKKEIINHEEHEEKIKVSRL
jgi:hypothetical protein